jgi:hypothetical protein
LNVASGAIAVTADAVSAGSVKVARRYTSLPRCRTDCGPAEPLELLLPLLEPLLLPLVDPLVLPLLDPLVELLVDEPELDPLVLDDDPASTPPLDAPESAPLLLDAPELEAPAPLLDVPDAEEPLLDGPELEPPLLVVLPDPLDVDAPLLVPLPDPPLLDPPWSLPDVPHRTSARLKATNDITRSNDRVSMPCWPFREAVPQSAYG